MTTRRDLLRTARSAGAAIWAGARFTVRVDGSSRLEDPAYLYRRS